MGPLKGIKILELAGIGPAPFCAMLFADMGADVIRIENPGKIDTESGYYDILNRGRRSLALDLKDPTNVASLLELVEVADGFIEGFRPGVTERLGLSPETCLARNPKLVYGRMTGWGQDGPLAHAAGHDLNYIALIGALDAIGTGHDGPVPPLNLLGDFGGGALYLAFGMVCALLETRTSGQGQVIDAAMVDGVASLMAMTYSMKNHGQWSNERGSNLLDGGAHFYSTYECADGKWVAISSIEPQFYELLITTLDLDPDAFRDQMGQLDWPELKSILAKKFKTRTREQWCELMEGTDICFAPVLDMDEAPQHRHNQARGTFVSVDDVVQPAPAPRFSRTRPELGISPNAPPLDLAQALEQWEIEKD